MAFQIQNEEREVESAEIGKHYVKRGEEEVLSGIRNLPILHQ